MKKAKTNTDRIIQLEAEVESLRNSVDTLQEVTQHGPVDTLNALTNRLKLRIEQRAASSRDMAKRAVNNLIENIKKSKG